jgi:hypothetical protein
MWSILMVNLNCSDKIKVVFTCIFVLCGSLAYGEYQSTETRTKREWGYLQRRVESAIKAKPAKVQDLKKILADIKAVDLKADQTQREQQYAKISAKLFHVLHPGKEIFATYSNPYRRLEAADIPTTKPVREHAIVTLPGEYQALGLTIANGYESPTECKVKISGFNSELFDFVVRKQEFVEHYYKKEEERLVDPLPKLVKQSPAWQLSLQPGQTTKLYVICKTTDNIKKIGGKEKKEFKGTIKLQLPKNQVIEMPLEILVYPVKKPAPESFPFLIFARLWSKSPMSTMPDTVAKDLADHYVTMIEGERALLPNAVFTKDGEIESIDFRLHDKLLKAYTPHVQSYLMFWQAYPYEKFKSKDGTFLEYKSEPWKKAYVNLLKAWQKHIKELGYDPKRFVQHVIEEKASVHIDKSPDENILWLKTMVGLTKSALPEAEISNTLCDYAFVEDVKVQIPLTDIMIVGLPYRESLPRNAPPTYNPRKTLDDVIMPMLKQKEKDGQFKLWSYHCQSGKNGNVFTIYRAWPVVQVANGMKGTGHWAYDDTHGSSWTADPRLDMQFS